MDASEHGPCLLTWGSQPQTKIAVEEIVTNNDKITIQVAIVLDFRKFFSSIILFILKHHEVETTGQWTHQYVFLEFRTGKKMSLSSWSDMRPFIRQWKSDRLGVSIYALA